MDQTPGRAANIVDHMCGAAVITAPTAAMTYGSTGKRLDLARMYPASGVAFRPYCRFRVGRLQSYPQAGRVTPCNPQVIHLRSAMRLFIRRVPGFIIIPQHCADPTG